MKKIIAISVMFALIAGAVFAQANISGGVGNGTKIINKSTEEDNDDLLTGGWTNHWGNISVNWTSEDNSAGAKLKINGDYNPGDSWDQSGLHPGGRIWWKPLDVVKIDFFKMQDEGVFGKGNFVDWGYQATAAAGQLTALWGGGWNSYSNGILRSGNGFYGGSGNGFGMGLTFGPFGDIFTANIYLPLEDASETTDKLFQAHVQFLINIDGVGELALSYKGNGGEANDDGKMANYGGGNFYVGFNLSALQGIGLEVSAQIPIGGKKDKEDEGKHPIEIGLGFGMNQWTSEAFHLYSRVGVKLASDDSTDVIDSWHGTYKKGTLIGVDINPSLQIGDLGRVYFDFGIGYAMFDQPQNAEGDDSAFVWHFSPYLKKSIGIGDFYVGIALWNNKIYNSNYEGAVLLRDKDFINFALPIYFEVSF